MTLPLRRKDPLCATSGCLDCSQRNPPTPHTGRSGSQSKLPQILVRVAVGAIADVPPGQATMKGRSFRSPVAGFCKAQKRGRSSWMICRVLWTRRSPSSDGRVGFGVDVKRGDFYPSSAKARPIEPEQAWHRFPCRAGRPATRPRRQQASSRLHRASSRQPSGSATRPLWSDQLSSWRPYK